jgi:hypothetical protein
MVFVFEPAGDETHGDAGEWPLRVVADGLINLELTHNRQPLNGGEATYVDQFGEFYVLTKLRTGQLVGDIRED